MLVFATELNTRPGKEERNVLDFDGTEIAGALTYFCIMMLPLNGIFLFNYSAVCSFIVMFLGNYNFFFIFF